MFFQYSARLFGDTFIELFTILIVLVDILTFFQSSCQVFGDQQVYRFFSRLHTSRSIDARPYFEYDVADCNIFVIQSAYFQYTS